MKEEVEPIYGSTYLPRKFKIAVATPHNDVDVNGNDLSFVAIAKTVNSKAMMFWLAVAWDAATAHQAPIHKLPKT